MKLQVNEIYGPVFQGEGKSLGMPCVFLRLAGCNLHCKWCDTPYAWNFGEVGEKRWGLKCFERAKEVQDLDLDSVISRLNALSCKNLVISGGEPMLQVNALIELCRPLKSEGWWIEVETNGTRVINADFIDVLDQINCSPKLESSGNELIRYNPEALKQYQKSGKANFKFVITSETDLLEINKIIEENDLKEIYIMPEGRTKAEQEAKQNEMSALAIQKGWNLTPRLHILMFGTARGI